MFHGERFFLNSSFTTCGVFFAKEKPRTSAVEG
jgi:hypothetical protein